MLLLYDGLKGKISAKIALTRFEGTDTTMSISRSRVSGAILAGGQSQRMGQDKASLLFDGEPLLLRIVRLMRGVVTNLAVIGPLERATLLPDIPVIPDRWPNCGPLGGIATALHASLSSQGVVVVGCDMPFLNPVLLRHLITLVSEADAVVVRLDGQKHPLHAVYQQRCLPILEAQLAVGDLRVHQFLTQINVRYVETPELDQFDPTHLSTFNCNTPEEWQQALRLLAQAQTIHSEKCHPESDDPPVASEKLDCAEAPQNAGEPVERHLEGE